MNWHIISARKERGRIDISIRSTEPDDVIPLLEIEVPTLVRRGQIRNLSPLAEDSVEISVGTWATFDQVTVVEVNETGRRRVRGPLQVRQVEAAPADG